MDAFVMKITRGFRDETAQFFPAAEKIYFQVKNLLISEFTWNLLGIYMDFASEWLISRLSETAFGHCFWPIISLR